MSPSAAALPVASDPSPLDFVWLELTNQCNLECVHCYAESGPTAGAADRLTEADYLALIEQVHELGCRKLQFIGGEPTLNRSLPRLIRAARERGFEFIEVFTNLLHLSDELLAVFREHDVAVATSFYSHDPATHDRITGRPGSFERTTRNIARVLEAGLRLRAGIIIMDENREEVPATWDYLTALGVKRIGSDRVRGVGRAGDGHEGGMGELCGSCAGDILSIGPDGRVAPCNMSKRWSVGSVLERRLGDIVRSPRLARVRRRIRKAVGEPVEGIHAICDPKTCQPYSFCCPSTQSCNPCAPNSCIPCYPKG